MFNMEKKKENKTPICKREKGHRKGEFLAPEKRHSPEMKRGTYENGKKLIRL